MGPYETRSRKESVSVRTDKQEKGISFMKYGLAELIEEKDIPDLYRKMIKEGAAWGCDWLNGFLESLNAEREPKDRFTVLVRHPGECDF